MSSVKLRIFSAITHAQRFLGEDSGRLPTSRGASTASSHAVAGSDLSRWKRTSCGSGPRGGGWTPLVMVR